MLRIDLLVHKSRYTINSANGERRAGSAGLGNPVGAGSQNMYRSCAILLLLDDCGDDEKGEGRVCNLI